MPAVELTLTVNDYYELLEEVKPIIQYACRKYHNLDYMLFNPEEILSKLHLIIAEHPSLTKEDYIRKLNTYLGNKRKELDGTAALRKKKKELTKKGKSTDHLKKKPKTKTIPFSALSLRELPE